VGDITVLLQRVQQGDPRAADELMARVYAELRHVAAAKMARERPGLTLQATALVHEAWLRLGGDAQPDWRNRAHFFAAAAEAMRRILVERARRQSAVRHGGALQRGDFAEAELVADGQPADDVVAVSEALEKLAALSPEKAELVKLRYFTGLAVDEAAQVLGISEATASRWWTFARAWLIQELAATPKP
jgi:RNA polymerase sigma factor (TIGR02999 family)